MNKRKMVFVLIIIIILGIFGILLYNNLTSYANVLKINWNIKLPSMKEVYSANSSESFHGDGIRYHIFSYQKEDKIETFVNWSVEEKETIYDSSYRESVNRWLSKLDVSKENYPNYSNCQYWYKKQEDNSEILLLWDKEEKKVYIVESFL